MEQWYKNGVTYGSQQAIRNNESERSLPHFLSDGVIEELGYVKVVDAKPAHTELQYLVEGDVVEVDGVPTKQYTVVDYTTEEIATMQAEAIAGMVQHFTDVTTLYIEGKVQEYNKANGLAFANIDAFAKYAVIPTSPHNTIAIKFISYADNIWTTLREYQSTLTAIPTDAEVQAVLDSVVF